MTLPRYLTEKKSIKKKANKSEKKVLKYLLKPNSGALWFAKGDFNIDDCLCELKSTNKKQIIVKLEFCRKIFEEAVKDNKFPFLVLNFEDKYLVVGSVIKLGKGLK